MCILSLNLQQQLLHTIQSSIITQNYSNFHHISIPSNPPLSIQSHQNFITVEKRSSQQSEYEQILRLYRQNCPNKCLIVLAQVPFAEKSLCKLNKVYQTRSVWNTYYTMEDGSLGMNSMYPQLLINAIHNDFHKMTARQIMKGNIPTLFSTIEYLSHEHSARINFKNFYSS